MEVLLRLVLLLVKWRRQALLRRMVAQMRLREGRLERLRWEAQRGWLLEVAAEGGVGVRRPRTEDPRRRTRWRRESHRVGVDVPRPRRCSSGPLIPAVVGEAATFVVPLVG